MDHAKTLRVAAERLRNGIKGTPSCGDALDEAANEIDRLRAALEPFADIRYPDAFPDGAGFASRRNGEHVSYGDIKRARAVLMPNAKVSGAGTASAGLTGYTAGDNTE